MHTKRNILIGVVVAVLLVVMALISCLTFPADITGVIVNKFVDTIITGNVYKIVVDVGNGIHRIISVNYGAYLSLEIGEIWIVTPDIAILNLLGSLLGYIFGPLVALMTIAYYIDERHHL